MSVQPMPMRDPRTVDSVVITPDQASEWLGHNQNNRNPKDGKIRLYARDMIEGRWRYTGESIKFDTAGRLLDGQNRLHACVVANVPFTSAVTFDLEPEAQPHMDTGSARTAADALRMNGHPNSLVLASTVTVLAAWDAGKIEHAMSISGGGRVALSHGEVLQYAEAHKDIADHITPGRNVARKLHLPPSACVAAVYLMSKVDQGDADDFCSRIIDQRTYGRGDPVVALDVRCRHLNDHGPTSPRASTALFVLFRSWNAFRMREDIHTLVLQRGGRWLRVPEPV